MQFFKNYPTTNSNGPPSDVRLEIVAILKQRASTDAIANAYYQAITHGADVNQAIISLFTDLFRFKDELTKSLEEKIIRLPLVPTLTPISLSSTRNLDLMILLQEKIFFAILIAVPLIIWIHLYITNEDFGLIGLIGFSLFSTLLSTAKFFECCRYYRSQDEIEEP